jgi:putative ABC transport system permease protein
LAQYVVDGGAADGVPSGAVQAALRIDGVARASGSMETAVLAATGEGNLRSLPAQGVDPAALQGLIDLGFASGSPSDIHGAAVGVSTTTARSFGWQVGDRVKVWLGDGAPTTVRVAATYRRPLGFGELVLPRSLVARHVTAPLDQAVFVTASPGTAERALVARLERLTRAYPGVDVLTRAQYQHGLETAAETQSLGVYVLLGVIGLFCGLALVNALTMATAERAREFAMLRLIGASTRQVTRMMRAETFIMVSFGLTIGSIIAAPALVAFSYGLTGSLAPSIPARAYAGLLAAYALVGFAATVVSTRLALRMNPVGAMAARD